MTAVRDDRSAAGGLPFESGDEQAILVTREVHALMTVSSAVAAGGRLAPVLDLIAREAAEVVGAFGASVLLLTPENNLKLAGAHGLSPGYGAMLDGDDAPPIMPGTAPSGLAMQSRIPVAIEDTELDDRVAPWRHVAAREGYRAMVSAPLVADGEALGALNVYRTDAAPWPQYQIALLRLFSAHAGSAIRTTQLLEQQQQQLTALSQLVATLREQRHEHGNRIHAISGLLALGEVQEAQRFVASLEHAYDQFQTAIVDRIHNPTLAGLVLSQMSIAHQRDITLTVDPRSRLHTLPPALTDAAAVTIVGNLVDNALDAVAPVPKSRRRVKLLIADRPQRTIIKVRDWGPGASSVTDDQLFTRGFSTKPEHDGIGLAIVAQAVSSAGGMLTVERKSQGVAFVVQFGKGNPS